MSGNEYAYDPTFGAGGAVVLPVGEHEFTMKNGRVETASTGAGMWVWDMHGEYDGQTVKRTYRIVLGVSKGDMTGRKLLNLADATGGDPAQPSVRDWMRQSAKPSSFDGRAVRALVRHRQYNGETRDDIDILIPAVYREAWMQHYRDGHDGQTPPCHVRGESTASQAQGESGGEDAAQGMGEIPF